MDTRNGARKAYWDRRFARSPKGPSPSELVDAEGIAMHTIVTNVPAEERERRMASPDPGEHRISYGCINFPPSFFADAVARRSRAGGRSSMYCPTRAAWPTSSRP